MFDCNKNGTNKGTTFENHYNEWSLVQPPLSTPPKIQKDHNQIICQILFQVYSEEAKIYPENRNYKTNDVKCLLTQTLSLQILGNILREAQHIKAVTWSNHFPVIFAPFVVNLWIISSQMNRLWEIGIVQISYSAFLVQSIK